MENPTTIAVLPPVSSQIKDTIGLEATTTMTEIEIKEDSSVRTGGTNAPAATSASSGHGPIQPVPMSFPAVLRNQGISDRFAHLRSGSLGSVSAPVVPKKSRRDDKDGKRWVRRKENGEWSFIFGCGSDSVFGWDFLVLVVSFLRLLVVWGRGTGSEKPGLLSLVAFLVSCRNERPFVSSSLLFSDILASLPFIDN